MEFIIVTKDRDNSQSDVSVATAAPFTVTGVKDGKRKRNAWKTDSHRNDGAFH